jgi:hypothetical protein
MLQTRIAAKLILGSLLVLPAFAQIDNCQHRTVTVSVTAPDGSPVPQLGSANFAGIYRKTSVHVTSAIMNREPIRVVLLLDVSGSMKGMGTGFVGKFSLDLAEHFVSNMAPETAIGLGYFYTELIPVLPPTTDRNSLLHQLEGLRTHPDSFKGRTAVWDAVLGSMKMFDHPRSGDVIYVITDGGDNASKMTVNHVVQILGESGIRLTAFVFQAMPAIRRTAEEEIGPPTVDEVARDTGGTILTQMTESVGSLKVSGEPTLFEKSGKFTPFGSYLISQYRQIGSFYRIGFDLSESLKKPQNWKLELLGLEKSQREKIALTYPHVLPACH